MKLLLILGLIISTAFAATPTKQTSLRKVAPTMLSESEILEVIKMRREVSEIMRHTSIVLNDIEVNLRRLSIEVQKPNLPSERFLAIHNEAGILITKRKEITNLSNKSLNSLLDYMTYMEKIHHGENCQLNDMFSYDCKD